MKTPLIKAFNFRLTPSEQRLIARLAKKFKKKWKLEKLLAPYREFQLQDDPYELSSLVLEDFSGVPFIQDIPGVEFYQLRSRTRALSNDFFAATQPEISVYENYNQFYLDLGRPRFVYAGGEGVHPFRISKAIRENKKVFDEVVEAVNRDEIQMIHPYMGSRDIWGLAKQVSAHAKNSIRVLAPPPPITDIANDKSKFGELVVAVLGKKLLPDCKEASSISELTDKLIAMSKKYPKVGLKMASYASAMGNQVFDSEKLSQLSKSDVRGLVKHFMLSREWDKKTPILVCEWKSQVLQSPSIQTWIPCEGKAAPIVEGVYEQILKGEEKVFAGSKPSTLPPALQKKMARSGFLVASLLQAIGYVGRCSFDLVLDGKSEKGSDFVYVECNGRWGGTSIPMSLCNRIFGDYRRVHYRSQDFSDPRLKGRMFEEVLKAMGKEVFDKRTGKGRFIFYNVGCLHEFGKFTVISLGKDVAEADQGLDEFFPKLLDRHFR